MVPPGLLLLLVLFTLLCGFAVTENLSYTPDSARYAAWARSVAMGDGLLDWTGPEPVRYVVHAPLYPILIAPAVLFGPSIIALKAATIIIALFMLTAFFFLLQKHTGRSPALLVTALFAFHPLTLHYSTQLLSETTFVLFLILLLLSLRGWEGSDLEGWQNLAWTAAAVSGVLLSREVGIVAGAAVLLVLLLKERYEPAGWLFVIILMVYGAWFVRNEVIVAAHEQPELRNTALLLSNVLTPAGTPLADEILARIGLNTAFYSREVPGLLFSSQFSFSGELQPAFYAVVDRSSTLIAAAQALVAPGFMLVSLLTAIVIVAGIHREWNSAGMTPYILPFVGGYLALVLIYPVADIRFLYPLLMLLFYYSAHGISGWGNVEQRLRIPFGLLLMVTLLPNMLWSIAFVKEARAFGADPNAYYTERMTDPLRTTEYTKPFSAVGQWLRAADTSEVILSRWKECALAAPGRKVVQLDVFTSVSRFERAIREHDVRFIIAARDRIGWREFEQQMALTREYSFDVEASFGGLDIIRVSAVSAEHPKSFRSSPLSAFLFHHLSRGQFDTVYAFYRGLASGADRQPMLRFYKSVTFESLGMFDSARRSFATLASLPQGVAAAQQAGFHNTIMDRIGSLSSLNAGTARADAMMNIALNYWELDLHANAFRFLNAAIAEDTGHIPAYNLFVYFALQEGDTSAAASVTSVMQSRFPMEPSTSEYRALFKGFTTLHTAGTALQRNGAYRTLAGIYDRLGLSEEALKAMRCAFTEDPADATLALQLSSRYAALRRSYPAIHVLKTAARFRPEDTRLPSALHALIVAAD